MDITNNLDSDIVDRISGIIPESGLGVRVFLDRNNGELTNSGYQILNNQLRTAEQRELIAVGTLDFGEIRNEAQCDDENYDLWTGISGVLDAKMELIIDNAREFLEEQK